MKKFLISLAAVSVAFAGLATAQQSNTNETTATLFTNNVDNFTSTTQWHTVNPEKLFGFLGVENGRYELELARNLGPLFLGTYFIGDFGSFTNTETSAAVQTETTSTTTTTVDNAMGTDDTNYLLGALVGFGPVGIKLGYGYGNSGSSYNDDGTTITSYDNTFWKFTAQAGLNLALGEKLRLMPEVGLGYAHNIYWNIATIASGITKVGGTTTDDTANCFMLSLGADAEFATNEKLTQTVGLNFDLEFNSFGSAFKTNVRGENPFDVWITPKYIAEYIATEKTTIAGGVTLGMFASAGDYSGFIFMPEINAGLQYQATDRLLLNLGLAFAVPRLQTITVTTTTTPTSTTKITQTTKTSSSNGTDGRVTIGTGFKFDFTKAVSLDFRWNLLNNILANSFNSAWNTASTADGFWGNMNTLFFADIGFLLLVKF